MSEEAPAEERGPGGGVRFVIPSEQEAGVYANAFAVWHTGFDFSIDFAASQPAERIDPDDPESPYVVPCRVVSRVRLPAGAIFELIRTINGRMSAYERDWGEIPTLKRPRAGE